VNIIYRNSAERKPGEGKAADVSENFVAEIHQVLLRRLHGLDSTHRMNVLTAHAFLGVEGQAGHDQLSQMILGQVPLALAGGQT